MNLVDAAAAQDRFVAIPLVVSFILKELDDYIEDDSDENLKEYLKAYYSIENTLPITSNYSGIPFITFKSSSLLNIRRKRFSGQYVFCSSEINLLNLLLVE